MIRKSLSIVSILLFILTIFLAVQYSCAKDDQTKAIIYTPLGEIYLSIDLKNAPVTSSNFINLCRQDVYSGAIFYRTVNNTNQPNHTVKIDVIQGGLFHDSLVEKYTPILHETTEMTGIKHHSGTISMARNEPGTASTEFFICIGDQAELDFGGARNPDGQGFSAFGKVTKGMDIVLKIHASKNTDQYIDQPVIIDCIKILN